MEIAKIRAARAWLNWSQSEFGRRCGMSQTQITRYENGDRALKQHELEKMIGVFNEAGIKFLENGILFVTPQA